MACGGAVVYWMEPLTLDQEVAGSIPVNPWHFCPSASTLYPLCCSHPRCINGYPVRCECYLSLDVACVRPWSGAWPECSPGSGEGALWVQDWYWIQWPRVIIHCKALWVVLEKHYIRTSCCCYYYYHYLIFLIWHFFSECILTIMLKIMEY